mgnify:CR=1 FL=1
MSEKFDHTVLIVDDEEQIGKSLGRAQGQLTVTNDSSARIIRLPLWIGLQSDQQEHVVTTLRSAIESSLGR